MLNFIIKLCLIVFCISVLNKAYAQKDSLILQKDTLSSIKTNKKHTPLRACLYSAALPGAGQVYNRKAWKVPIVWAALGGVGYLLIDNNKNYKIYRKAYLYRVDSDPTTKDDFPNRTQSELKLYRDQYLRLRDYSILGFTFVYFLNIVDAFVDSHFFNFDISDDLSMRWNISAPLPYHNQNSTPMLNLSISLKSKKTLPYLF